MTIIFKKLHLNNWRNPAGLKNKTCCLHKMLGKTVLSRQNGEASVSIFIGKKDFFHYVKIYTTGVSRFF